MDRDTYYYDKDTPYSKQIIRKRESEYREERPVKEECPYQK
jgi:hypothetical protein